MKRPGQIELEPTAGLTRLLATSGERIGGRPDLELLAWREAEVYLAR